MSKLFNEEMLEFNSIKDWKECVNRGVELLVNKKYATKELADAIFKSTEQFGAYYVLEHGLALLHAAPGPYSLKNGASVMVLDDFVQFNNQEDKYAKVIITLCAVDSHSHLDILREFAHYFTNEEFKKELYQAKNINEVKTLIQKFK